VLTVGNAVQFGVTIEPPGGSPQPSTDPVGIVTITE